MHTRMTLGFVLLIAASLVKADGDDLSASRVFEVAAPSIVVVEAHNKVGATVARGSGVVIAKGVVVSNCHVFTKADIAIVRYSELNYPAELQYGDMAHDLCSFTVNGLPAPPVRISSAPSLKVGESAFAIGAPEGLELTLSGGLISSLRKLPDGVVIQMTTPISPGSSGGGLFDAQAHLIGITSYYMSEGQQLNFALPVEWVSELPRRGSSTKEEATLHRPPAATYSRASQAMQPVHQAIAAGDYAKAVGLLRPLVAAGYSDAEAWLATLYMAGNGVPQDYDQAVALLGKAANAGNASAIAGLGVLYQEGFGVHKDIVAAYALYNVSAALAEQTLDNAPGSQRTALSTSMTDAQIQAGQQMTRDIQQFGVTAALGLTRPPLNASAAVWSRYFGLIVRSNMQGMTTDQPYAFLVAEGNTEESKALNAQKLVNVRNIVHRGAVPGVLLAFAGPDSSTTAAFITTAFEHARVGSFNGAIILFIGDLNDAKRVQHGIAKSGAIFRFVQMK